MCDTPNRPLRKTWLLPTGHWGTAAFDSNTGHVKHANHWKPFRRAWMCNIWPYNSIPMSVLWGRLPTGQWGTPSYSQPATGGQQLYGKIGHIKHRKPCLGALVSYFGTNNPFLMYALFLILPTGHWGTPHYSQPATEERQHLTTIQGTWNTPNIENHLGGPGCVIFDHIIQSRCLSYGGDSQPASQEHPVTPNLPLRSESCMGRWGTLNIENHVWGPWCVISGQIILSWCMH